MSLTEHLSNLPLTDITPLNEGLVKQTYRANYENQPVIISYGKNCGEGILKRLASLGVTPPVLDYQQLGDNDCVIQPFIEAPHPNRAWFMTHQAELIHFFKSFHQDSELNNLIPKTYSSELCFISEMTQLERALPQFGRYEWYSKLQQEFLGFKKQGEKLSTKELVPVHVDLNPKNFLISQEQLYVVDWDDIMLSDPLHDIGVFLWWFFPQKNWQSFTEQYGLPYTSEVEEKIFWWAACQSLNIAIWHHQNKGAGLDQFIEDFFAATNHQFNPHQ